MTEERKKARAKGMFGLSVVVGFMAFAFAKGGELNDWNATGLGIACGIFCFGLLAYVESKGP